MKYKKGDRVVLKSKKMLEEIGVTPAMEARLKGTDRVVEVVSQYREFYGGNYHIGDPLKDYMITDEMILGYAFEESEKIEVSDDGKKWRERKFRCYCPGEAYPIHTLDGDGRYKFARPIPEGRQEKMIIALHRIADDFKEWRGRGSDWFPISREEAGKVISNMMELKEAWKKLHLEDQPSDQLDRPLLPSEKG